jgi:hypothetical protein
MTTNSNFRIKNGLEVSEDGIIFSDATTQTTKGQSAFIQVGRDVISTATTSTLAIVLDSGTDAVNSGTNAIAGLLAFYDRTNSRWAYIHNNAAVTTIAPGPGPDPYYDDLVFLTVADDGAGNQAGAATITNNNITASSTQKLFSNTNSWRLNGTNGTIGASGTGVAVGTGNWTLDFWMWDSSGNSSFNAVLSWNNEYQYRSETDNSWKWYDFDAGVYPASFAESPTTNGWSHVAIERHGTNFNIYVNGTRTYQRTGVSTNVNNSQIWFGGENTTSKLWEGYMDYIRLTAVARYESAATITVPASDAEYREE